MHRTSTLSLLTHPVGCRRIRPPFHKPHLHIHLRVMETTLLWPLFFSHGRRIRANIIRRPKATTSSIPFPGKMLSSIGTLKRPDWPCYLHSWQTQVQALRAICPAGRRSLRGTLTESWMGKVLPPSKPRVRTSCFLPQMDGSRNDVGGLLWYSGDSDDASLNPALNAAMLLTRYAQIASTPDKKKNYLVRFASSVM